MRARAATGLAILLLALPACSDNEPAIARGDRLWADSDYVDAGAEYRLAAAQRVDNDALIRLAHAYARTGDLDAAREAYQELVPGDPRYAPQAAADYLRIARRSLERGDEYGVATAIDAALSLQPEIQLPEFALPLARYYTARGDIDRALDHYRRALQALPADSAPRLYYEMGLLEENRERCTRAIDLFEAARFQARKGGSSERGGPWRQLMTESRWHLGSCSFELARQAREAGRVTESMVLLERMIALGVPENLLDQAYFDHAEILYGIGRFDDALASYRQVLERNPTRTGQLVERATRRIDEIRFGTTSGGDATGAPGGDRGAVLRR